MQEELLRLYEEDQADRIGQMHPDMRERDRARRQRVEELISGGALQAAGDYFHAAMVFQHGETLDHYRRAHELAKKAAEMGHSTGRWLTAAAYDRWLMKQGKPQKYGTQYTSRGDEPYRFWDVDPTTTDEERAAWNVPPLAQALRRAEELTRQKEELRQQGTPQAQGPQRFARLEVPGLSVEIIDFDERFVQAVPEQERPAREELPASDGFPAGWKLYRVGEGYVATTAEGQEVITWYHIGQPELRYAWRGVECVEVRGRIFLRIRRCQAGQQDRIRLEP